MVFIRVNIQILHFLFPAWFLLFGWKLKLMDLIFHRLPAYLCCQTAAFPSAPVRCLYCFLKQKGLSIFCHPLMFAQTKDPVDQIGAFSCMLICKQSLFKSYRSQ